VITAGSVITAMIRSSRRHRGQASGCTSKIRRSSSPSGTGTRAATSPPARRSRPAPPRAPGPAGRAPGR
jgi:hypothetical protein